MDQTANNLSAERDSISQEVQQGRVALETSTKECENLKINLETLGDEVARLRPAAAKAEALSELLITRVAEIQQLGQVQAEADKLTQALSERDAQLLQLSKCIVGDTNWRS